MPYDDWGNPLDDESEDLRERICDEIERVLLAHEPIENDSRCTCGVRNNMDGDVLHAHRMAEMDEAVYSVLRNRRVARQPHDEITNV